MIANLLCFMSPVLPPFPPLSARIYEMHLAPMMQRNLDDLMNNEIREKIGIVPPDVIWGGMLYIYIYIYNTQ